MALPALDFPASPIVGQLYPDPPVTGQPTYKWDGAQWLAYRASGVPGLTVPAAPFDALAYNGMQVNGSMEVSQENGSTAVSFVGGSFTKYIVDGFYVKNSSTAAFTAQQSASVFYGYNSELKLTITTALAVSGAEDIVIYGMIEGYRFVRARWGTSNAVPVTVGFWVRSSVAGVLFLQIANEDISHAANATVTIAAANTSQWVTATFPAYTTGVWNPTNGTGARLRIFPASWNGINVAATVGNTFEITGVVVLPGIEAPTAAQSSLIMRPYDQELVTCQRYYTKTEATARFYAAAAGHNVENEIYWQVKMRAAPTLSRVAGLQANISSVVATQPTISGARFNVASAAAGDCYSIQEIISADARL